LRVPPSGRIEVGPFEGSSRLADLVRALPFFADLATFLLVVAISFSFAGRGPRISLDLGMTESPATVEAAFEAGVNLGRSPDAAIMPGSACGGEIVLLELDDVHFRTGEMVIRGNGGMVDRLPLLADIGEALALYIRQDRSVSESRRGFQRHPSHVGLAGPAATGHIVRQALARAGVRRSGRGAAHLFHPRHRSSGSPGPTIRAGLYLFVGTPAFSPD